MTEQEAKTLVTIIECEYPGRIHAATDTRYTNNQYQETGKNRYRVHLTLLTGQRTMTICTLDQWESVLDAWQWFLCEKRSSSVRIGPKPRHLVDGIPMYIFQNKQGYWLGTYTKDKASHKHYFGKIDPRPDYPLYEEQKEEVLV